MELCAYGLFLLQLFDVAEIDAFLIDTATVAELEPSSYNLILEGAGPGNLSDRRLWNVVPGTDVDVWLERES